MEQRNKISLDLMTFEQGEKIISLLEGLLDAFNTFPNANAKQEDTFDLIPSMGRYEQVEFPDVIFNLFYDRFSEGFVNENGRMLYPPNGTPQNVAFDMNDEILPTLEELGFTVRVFDTNDYDKVCGTFGPKDVNMFPVDMWADMSFGQTISNISDKAKDLIREHKMGLFLSIIGEAFSPDEHRWIRKLSESIIAYNLQAAKIVITCADLRFDQNYSKWGQRNVDLISKFSFTGALAIDYFQWQYCIQFLRRTGRYSYDTGEARKYGEDEFAMSRAHQNEIVLSPADSSKKEVDLLCMNSMSRPHRIAMVSELYRLGLQDNYISLLFRYQKLDAIYHETELITYLLSYFKTKEQKTHFKKMFVEDRTSKTITLDDRETALEDDRTLPTEYFEKSFFSLVTETCFAASASASHGSGFVGLDDKYNSVLFATEKTFKPIAYFHPFMILGPQGILQYLRDEGYQTFPEMFDESYDFIENHVDRFNAVVAQVEAWKNKPHEEKIKIYDSIKPKLIHNHNIFTTKLDTLNKRQRNFYKYIGSLLK